MSTAKLKATLMESSTFQTEYVRAGKDMPVRKFLLFSDFHAHNHQYAATLVKDPVLGVLLNSRLVDSLNVLREMTTVAVHSGISEIFFAGDLFHKRNSVPTDVLWAVAKTLESQPVNYTLVVGNHDQGYREGELNSVHTLGFLPNVTVVSQPQKRKVASSADQYIHFLPFVEDPQVFTEWARAASSRDIVIGHAAIKGGVVGADFVLESDHDVDPKDIQTPLLSLFGHYHQHQVLWGDPVKDDNQYTVTSSTGIYIGASHEHNWGDSGGERGYLIVDIDHEGEYITMWRMLTSAPRFVKDEESAKPKDFVRLREAPKGSYAHVEVVPISKDETTIRSIDNIDAVGIVKEWATLKGQSEEVTNVGLDIIKEVLNERG